MPKRLINTSVRSVMLLGSSACDMRCGYCYLHKNKAANAFDPIVKDA
jgi:sulfatase maturation enzyme AslB (radical SAM superfamily)